MASRMTEETVSTGVFEEDSEKKGQIALFMAAETGHIEKIHELIRGGVCVDCTDKEGKTALMIAVAHRKFNAMSAIVSHYPNLKKKNNRGLTAIDYTDYTDDSRINFFLKKSGSPISQGEAYARHMS